jgi:predicted metal-dependent hydrolase
MNTKNKIKICNLMVETVKKDIKNINIGVYPPNGRVRIATPLNTTDESLRLLVISKSHWIKKQQAKFTAQERQTRREFVSGETHYLFGKKYLLNVSTIKDKPKIEIKRPKILNLYINKDSEYKIKEKIFDEFYRLELKKQIISLIKKWETKIGITIRELKIRKMKTKWGTCNSKAKRIWLNLELAKKPQHCIEYVLVHEMIHFLVKGHNNKFKELINLHMPQWEQYKKELNIHPLGFNTWK